MTALSLSDTPMTVPELMEATELSVATVRRAVRALRAEHKIQLAVPKWRDGQGRGYFQYVPVPEPDPGAPVPAGVSSG